MNQEIALDLRRYNTSNKLASLPQDTASLAIEASSNPDVPRVNVTYLVKNLGQNKVVTPGRDRRDVREMFVEGDLLSSAGNEIAQNLENDPDNFIYFWISPSGPYPESRIQVGSKRTTPSGRADYVKRYDISSIATREQCLQLGQLLASMVPGKVDYPENPDQLKGMILKLRTPLGKDPFEYISEILKNNIPEKDVFEKILDKTVDRNKAKILKTAHKVTKNITQNQQYIFSNPTGYGAYVETQMAREGYGMDPEKFGCGASNVSTSASPTHQGKTFAGVMSYSEGQRKYVKNCGACGAVIESVISAGYVCSQCSGIYQGC